MERAGEGDACLAALDRKMQPVVEPDRILIGRDRLVPVATGGRKRFGQADGGLAVDVVFGQIAAGKLRELSAASVAAVRETSVVIATVLAGAVLKEPVISARLSGAALVAGGVALIRLM